jgi:serine/threonine protein phosphatase PrpC
MPCKVMDKKLRFHPTIDCFYNRTIVVTPLKQEEDLVMGNVGDSRAIMGTGDNDISLIAVKLTVDLKPNLPKEAERIKQFKGQVFALSDELDVAWVWLPHEDSLGLAMTSAFGDFCLEDFGLIVVPHISYRKWVYNLLLLVTLEILRGFSLMVGHSGCNLALGYMFEEGIDES